MKNISLIAIFVSAWILPVTLVSAQTRTSANYSMTTEAIDDGGETATSAAYTMNGSAGTIGGISSASSPEETVKGGYAGQLYDLVGLQIATPSNSVDIAQTLQLQALGSLDDGTI